VTNVILSVLQKDETLKTVCLAGDIIGADGTAEEQVRKIIQSFGEGGNCFRSGMCGQRRCMKMIPSSQLQSLLDMIPRKNTLCVSRLLKSYITTDKCSTARKVQYLLSARIIEIAQECGINVSQSCVKHLGKGVGKKDEEAIRRRSRRQPC